MRTVFERFNDVYQFSDELAKRPLNKVFKGETRSSKKNDDWYGTRTWSEAEDLLRNGWAKNVEKIAASLEKYRSTIEVEKRQQELDTHGFAPCVAAAIQGHPMSMFNYSTVKTERKEKVLHILYAQGAACYVSEDTILKWGTTVLKLVALLEANGVRVKMDICPFASYSGSEYAGCLIGVKDYHTPLNIKKMSYPIAHTAAFRRHGFAWLESTPDLSSSSWTSGYGKSMRYADKADADKFWAAVGVDTKNYIYIDTKAVEKAKNDPKVLLEQIWNEK